MSFIFSKPFSVKWPLTIIISTTFLKSLKFKSFEPCNGNSKKKGIILSWKAFKELTVKSQPSVLRFSTLPQPKNSAIPLSSSTSRECGVILKTNCTAKPNLDFNDL